MSDPNNPQSGWPPPGAQAPPPPAQYSNYGGYPQPGYGGLREHPSGTTILVLGILSLVVCQILGPFAWSMGNNALAEIDASPGSYSNRGSVSAGRICGMVSTILLAISIVLVIVFVIIAVAAGSSSS